MVVILFFIQTDLYLFVSKIHSKSIRGNINFEVFYDSPGYIGLLTQKWNGIEYLSPYVYIKVEKQVGRLLSDMGW